MPERVLLTGATGFLGMALLERLLHDDAGPNVVLLIRPRAGQGGADRLEHLLRNPVFRTLDDVQARAARRVTVIEGDLSAPPPIPADVDVVVHCAGDVSFDPGIDEGFATNVRGAELMLTAIRASGARPHYVHVSTAYVAGLRRGVVLEGPHDHVVDWRAEASAAARLRESIEDASRSPQRLAQFTRAAERDHHRAGPQTVAADAERRRRDWVHKQLVDAGRERARSLGWTDCYTFTKALGERVVEELGADLPVTIVRPSIIESALATPYPGWIEGFKMAEPLILAYGRGELPEFPAVPEGILDVIPVDIVVAAMLAVLRTTPTPGQPDYFHVSSGARNPLAFRAMYENVRDYFAREPLEKRARGAIAVPTWRFPGSERVEATLRRAERLAALADRAVGHLPRSERLRERVRELDRQQGRLEFLRRYTDLYRPYVEAQILFDDTHTRALLQSADAVDVTDIDWAHYLQRVHCPSVTAMLRRGRSTAPAPTRGTPNGLTRSADTVAVFDLEGTLLPSNVVEGYLWLRVADAGLPGSLRELTDVARAVPGYLRADRRDRAAMLRSVYRRYAGAGLHELDRIVDEQVADIVLSRLSAAAVRRIREHRAAGHRTILLTGAIRALTRPLAPLFDEIVAADLAVDAAGRATGFLVQPPLVAESRASWLRHRAHVEVIDLVASYAYADSATDVPLLRAVGHPVAVNPDVTLTRTARRHNWPVEVWRSSADASRIALPRRAAS